MKMATIKEYEEAKGEIINGVEFEEHTTNPNQYGMISKTYSTVENGNFYEVTDPDTGIIEFWSDKYATSRYYDGRSCEEIICSCEEIIGRIKRYERELAAAVECIKKTKAENEQLKTRVKELRRPCGTHMTQEDYARLEKSGKPLTDAEAIVLINKEFGFEAARIDILHEAEVDTTEDGARYVKTEKVKREPIYEATDWNYIRFNVRTAPATWYYEMIDAQLYEVLL